MSATGSCNCGAYKVTAPPSQGVAVCHCKNCQRGGGSLGSLNAVVDLAQFKVEPPLEKAGLYVDRNTDSGNPIHRHFCQQCGSPIISIPKGASIGYFKVPILDDAESYAPKFNMALYTDSATKTLSKDCGLDYNKAGVKAFGRGMA